MVCGSSVSKSAIIMLVTLTDVCDTRWNASRQHRYTSSFAFLLGISVACARRWRVTVADVTAWQGLANLVTQLYPLLVLVSANEKVRRILSCSPSPTANLVSFSQRQVRDPIPAVSVLVLVES